MHASMRAFVSCPDACLLHLAALLAGALGFVRKQVRTLCACFAAKAWELFLDNSLGTNATMPTGLPEKKAKRYGQAQRFSSPVGQGTKDRKTHNWPRDAGSPIEKGCSEEQPWQRMSRNLEKDPHPDPACGGGSGTSDSPYGGGGAGVLNPSPLAGFRQVTARSSLCSLIGTPTGLPLASVPIWRTTCTDHQNWPSSDRSSR